MAIRPGNEESLRPKVYVNGGFRRRIKVSKGYILFDINLYLENLTRYLIYSCFLIE